jgi:primase-polymerase (primpol)-like protein
MAAITYPLDHALLANIPSVLLDRPQWVCAQLVPREDGSLNKIPMNPANGRRASATDPATWGTFAEAVTMAEARGWGVGFVLVAGGGVVAIDLDHCIDGAGAIAPEAAAIMERFATYAERSISGTGIHLLCLSDPKPGTTCKHEARGIELYDRDRFMVMTGDLLPGSPADLEPRTAMVHALYRELWPEPVRERVAIPAPILSLSDEAIIENARRMTGFRRLYDGADTSAYGDDDSSADLGMLNYLVMAGATDPVQLDRIYRSSPLARSKWDERRGSMTYGERTIVRALDGTVQPFEGFIAPPAILLGTSATPNPQDAASGTIGHAEGGNASQDLDQDDDLPDDTATLKQIIRNLTRHVAQMQREQEQMRQRLTMMSEVQSRTAAIQRNKNIGQTRQVAIATVNYLANRESAGAATPDGLHPIYLDAIAESAGVSKDTASRHLDVLSTADVGFVKETRPVRNEDGTIGKRVYIGLAAGTNVIDFAAAVATMDREQRPWGGARVSCPTCGPDAEVEKRTTIVCRGCGEILAERVQTLNPQDAASEEQAIAASIPNPQDAASGQPEPRRGEDPNVVDRVPLAAASGVAPQRTALPLLPSSLDRYTDPLYGRTG